jgi:hypothetical protein
LIEQIGAYAGLAAIPGLAVLSALYFSQARDVKRLRDWAGRAPERSAEQAMGGRVAAQPQQQAAQPAAGAATPAVPAAQAAQAKPAVAAAAGAQAATAAAPATATPAQNSDKDGEKKAADKPAALTPAAVASAAAASKAPAKAGAAATAGGGGNATGTVTRPGPPAVAGGARPGTTPAARRTIPRPASSQTSILTPTSPPRDRWYRRLANRLPAGRYVALIVAGALVLGGGAAYGITQLASKDSSGGGGGSSPSAGQPSSSPGSKSTSSSKKGSAKSTPTVNPRDVTVTVVNGTTIPNLARDTATKLAAFGFQIGNKVTGTGSLAAAESVVEYKPGAEEEARLVAAKLHISQKQPADGDALAQAGPAPVIVVLGADQAPGG